ncbi:hypothetical protein MLD38_017473 [Melastoma candidum]|uniref:Uncharacterized protein n=1 Tax=Melastoma candidum TaxID=119954 RepID=A0ACB9QTV5_9MYRT|nr:hypothetical protein MLD38_017473 [Melastoma candidum]
MVKFSKQFEGQLIPEWKEAFVDYTKLKKDLKQIHLEISQTNQPNENNRHITFFSSLANFTVFGQRNRDHEAIHVHKKLASSVSFGDLYETELLEQLLADCEAAKEFFSFLDYQLSKVNQFYRTKEKEFLDRGKTLKQQIDILIELKSRQEGSCNGGRGGSVQDCEEDISISSISSEEDSIKCGTEQNQLQGSNKAEEEADNSEMPFTEFPKVEELGNSKRTTLKRQDSKSRSQNGRSFRCQGKNLKLSIPLTTPTRTLSVLSYVVWEDLLNQSSRKLTLDDGNPCISKSRLHSAEKMIRRALIELYKGLGYLDTYRNLNMLAFIKILKKFDKVTGKQVLPIYLKVVESSYFNTAYKVTCLADEVEQLFVKHFAEEDRAKAMKYLKPTQKKDSHSKTFFVGLFTGCFLVLFVGYVITAHVTGMYRRQADTVYMETVYPVLSMFSLLFLHLFLYGCNIFAWKKARINYSFILELAPTKELKYRDVYLICAVSMTIVVGILFSHLSLLEKGYSYSQVQVIPGLLVLAFVVVLASPVDILYRSSRYRFLRVMRNIMLSPLYKVVMLDFFMADQLCSQVPMLRNLESVTCYYITGSFKTQDYGYCMRNKHYRELAYAVSFLPYYWRAMQCARRWFDEGETSHLVNLGKYVSAMFAAGAKVLYEREQGIGWLCLVVVISSFATMYQLYWDFVRDWGLLQFNSKNPWLRNDLILRRKILYYLAMVVNSILRLAWLQTVLHYSFENVDYRVTGLFLASLEVIRRGLWNFFRLENEHLNNAGRFRAVKAVPLPFHEVDEED